METHSDVWLGDLSAYIVIPHKLRYSYPTRYHGTYFSNSTHSCSSISTPVTASPGSTSRSTSRPVSDTSLVTRSSKKQFLDFLTYRQPPHAHVTVPSGLTSNRKLESIVCEVQEHGTCLRHRENNSTQFSVTTLHNQVLPIRTRPSRENQCGLSMSQENQFLERRYNSSGTKLKSTPTSNQSATSEWDYVVRRVILQHSRDCPEHQDIDERSLTQILRSLTITKAGCLNEKTSPTAIPHLRTRTPGTQASASQSNYSQHASSAPSFSKQGSKSKGKQREQPPGDDPDPDKDDDDRQHRRSRDPATHFLEQTSFKLICPFVKSPQYRHLKECSRCLTADLPTLETLIQHLKRTHNWCVKCASRSPENARFATLEEFEEHRPVDNQCCRCHQVFPNDQLLQEHRQKSKKRPHRDRRSRKEKEKENYGAIWKSILPNEKCPNNYRSNIRNVDQAMDLLQRLPQSCKDGIVRQLALVLKQGNGTNDEDMQYKLELVNACLGSTSTVSHQPNHQGGVFRALQDDGASPDSVDDSDELDNSDDLDAAELSQRSYVECLHDSSASQHQIHQTPISDYDVSNYQPLSDTMHSHESEMSNSSGQEFVDSQLLGFGAHAQLPLPSAYDVPGQTSPLSFLYAAQVPFSHDSMSADLDLPRVAPPSDHTSGQMWAPAAQHPIQSMTSSLFRDENWSQDPSYDTGGPSGSRRGGPHPYDIASSNSHAVNQVQHTPEQDQTHRPVNPALDSSRSIPPHPCTDVVPGQYALADAFTFLENTSNRTWIDRAFAQTDPRLDERQQYHQHWNTRHQPLQIQPRPPLQQSSKRRRYGLNP